MRTVAVRHLKDHLSQELGDLPVSITRDGEAVAVILSAEQYARLQSQAQPTMRLQSGDTRFRQADVVPNQVYREHSQDATTICVTPSEPPWYDPAVHKPGDLVRVSRGQKVLTLTVPELDGDGHPVPL